MVEVNIDVAAIMEKVRQADHDARLEYAQEDLQPASDEKCPVLTGTMVGTSLVEDEGEDITLTYGPLPYVLKQFYDDTLNHPNGGESHWSEKAAVETADKLTERMAAKLEEAFPG